MSTDMTTDMTTDMSAEKDVRLWNRLARKYAAMRISDTAEYDRTIAETRSLLGPRDRVLEIGCGTGMTALRLADAAGTYLATDYASAMIAIAEEKHAGAPVPGLAFRSTTVEALPADTPPFNAVIAFNVLHLARDLPGMLRRIHGLLTPDGVFVSKTPGLGDMNPLIRLVVLPVLRALGKAPWVATMRTEDLVAHLEAAGFTVVTRERHSSKGKAYRAYLVARKA